MATEMTFLGNPHGKRAPIRCYLLKCGLGVTELIPIVLSNGIGIVAFFGFLPRSHRILQPNCHAQIVRYDRFGMAGLASCRLPRWHRIKPGWDRNGAMNIGAFEASRLSKKDCRIPVVALFQRSGRKIAALGSQTRAGDGFAGFRPFYRAGVVNATPAAGLGMHSRRSYSSPRIWRMAWLKESPRT